MRADFLPNLQMKVGILALQVISADFDRVDEGQILLRIAVVDSAFNLRYILLKKLPHDVSSGSSKLYCYPTIQSCLDYGRPMKPFFIEIPNFWAWHSIRFWVFLSKIVQYDL